MMFVNFFVILGLLQLFNILKSILLFLLLFPSVVTKLLSVKKVIKINLVKSL